MLLLIIWLCFSTCFGFSSQTKASFRCQVFRFPILGQLAPAAEVFVEAVHVGEHVHLLLFGVHHGGELGEVAVCGGGEPIVELLDFPEQEAVAPHQVGGFFEQGVGLAEEDVGRAEELVEAGHRAVCFGSVDEVFLGFHNVWFMGMKKPASCEAGNEKGGAGASPVVA